MDRLVPGQSLFPGDTLISPDHRFTLTYQTDGNLVLYQGTTALWHTGTSNTTPGEVAFQADSNFVVYQSGGQFVWQAGAGGLGGVRLVLQNDGNLVMYNAPGAAVWYTGTCCH
jgi:hypothetical protein